MNVFRFCKFLQIYLCVNAGESFKNPNMKPEKIICVYFILYSMCNRLRITHKHLALWAFINLRVICWRLHVDKIYKNKFITLVNFLSLIIRVCGTNKCSFLSSSVIVISYFFILYA